MSSKGREVRQYAAFCRTRAAFEAEQERLDEEDAGTGSPGGNAHGPDAGDKAGTSFGPRLAQE